MKLLQLNTWGGRLEHQIFDMFAKEKPDIACLQETISFPPGNTGFLASVEEYQQKAGFKEVFFSPTLHFNYMKHTAGYGNTILSQFPIAKQHTLFTGGTYVEDFDTETSNFNSRNLQHAVVKTPNGEVHVLNHHGYHIPDHKNGDEETMRQCALIVDYIKDLKGKIILTGDFNLSPHSESLELINAVLKNLSIEAGLTTTRNPLTRKNEVCDYIFINDSVQVKKFAMLPDMASDHNALTLEFE